MISKRIKNITPSQSVRMSTRVAELTAAGEEVTSLNVGESDFQTPPRIIQATINALNENKTRYGLVEGIIELRDKIAEKTNLTIGNESTKISRNNIILGNGSKHILYSIFQSLLDPGDEVIINAPYWVTFPESVKLAGGVPIVVDTKEDFQLDIQKITNAITKKTKCLILNSPNNPTGAVYPKKDIEKLIELAKKNNFIIISDEAYELLTYSEENFSPPAFYDRESFKYVLTVRSFSKSYGMTGFRIGYLIGPQETISAIHTLQSHLSGNNCTFAQYGALEALDIQPEDLKEVVDEIKARRDILYKGLRPIFPHLILPEGAFYLFAPLRDSGLEQNCEELAMDILEKVKLAILPGSYFGTPNHLRFSFASSRKDIEKAIEKLHLYKSKYVK